eukprot:Rhum_TRINITY_DN20818_c0_g1::Rhum_TRINITY_DN20818_c0_g1_i1::g.172305::m.172305
MAWRVPSVALWVLVVSTVLLVLLRADPGDGEPEGIRPEIVAAYNSAVEAWGGSAGQQFRGAAFEVLATVEVAPGVAAPPGLNATSVGWQQLVKTNPDEGAPPEEGFRAYEAVSFDLNKAVIPYTTPFVPSLFFRLYVREAAASKRRRVSDFSAADSVVVPAFFWAWNSGHVGEGDCVDAGIGVWLDGACLRVYALDHVCVTVSHDTEASWPWGVRKRFGLTGRGCSPTVYDGVGLRRDDLLSYGVLGDWSAGYYAQANASEIMGTRSLQATPGRDEVNGTDVCPRMPYRLPTSLETGTSWKANFSAISLRVRSTLDPLLTAEAVTNGTLAYPPSPPEASFTSQLRVVVVGLSAVCAVSAAALLLVYLPYFGSCAARLPCFPSWSPDPSPTEASRRVSGPNGTKLQSQSFIYP